MNDKAGQRFDRFLRDLNGLLMRHRQHITMAAVVVEVESQERALAGNAFADQVEPLLREGAELARRHRGRLDALIREPRSS